ncbi:hypothetical protein NPIL_108581 [Nephila pilipes]|uniref:Uncharacterized protein n=1 Tax=Nephila pilipes TaxID=299642 RepID=A0A8X6QM33_NEPPI|nr:hypothetical protein NPIL_108571 [Nephila pilipes]GFU20845.1 hypothetical protein NPIL_108581 [Nephila pilipes]
MGRVGVSRSLTFTSPSTRHEFATITTVREVAFRLRGNSWEKNKKVLAISDMLLPCLEIKDDERGYIPIEEAALSRELPCL